MAASCFSLALIADEAIDFVDALDRMVTAFLAGVFRQNATLSLVMMEFDQIWTFVYHHTCPPCFDSALRRSSDSQMTYLNCDGASSVVTWTLISLRAFLPMIMTFLFFYRRPF